MALFGAYQPSHID